MIRVNRGWDGSRRNWQNLRNIRDSFFQFMEQSIGSLSRFRVPTIFVVKKYAIPGVFVITKLRFTSTLGVLRVMYDVAQLTFCLVQSLMPFT